jgi:hypothetical protein
MPHADFMLFSRWRAAGGSTDSEPRGGSNHHSLQILPIRGVFCKRFLDGIEKAPGATRQVFRDSLCVCPGTSPLHSRASAFNRLPHTDPWEGDSGPRRGIYFHLVALPSQRDNVVHQCLLRARFEVVTQPDNANRSHAAFALDGNKSAILNRLYRHRRNR